MGTSLRFSFIKALEKNAFKVFAFSILVTDKSSCLSSNVLIPDTFLTLDVTYFHNFFGLHLLSSASIRS